MFVFWSFFLYLFYCFAIGFAVSYWDVANLLLNGLHMYVTAEEESRKIENDEDNSKMRVGPVSQRKKKNAVTVADNHVDQIGRAKVTSMFLFGRFFYKEYNEFMTFVLIGMLSFSIYILYLFLPESRYSLLDQGNSVTLLMGLISIWRLCKSMFVIQWHFATTNKIDQVVSSVVGILIFLSVFFLLFQYPHVLDFDWDKATLNAGEILANHLNAKLAEGQKVYEFVPISPTFIKFILSVISGIIAFLLLPCALRVARSYHVSTFPTSWDVGVLQSPWFIRYFLHTGIVFSILSTLLWINPLSSLFIVQCTSANSNSPSCDDSADRFDWSRSHGLSKDTFESLRTCLLLSSAILQLLCLRIHVQGYLNSGLGIWFENTHGIYEISRLEMKNRLQKVTFFVCKVALQCVTPNALVILFLGLTFSKGAHLDRQAFDEAHLIPPMLFREFFSFLAWICTSIWVVEFLPILTLFRLGQVKAF